MTELAGAPAARAGCAPWKFWGTLIWTAAAIAGWVAMQIGVFAAMLAASDSAADLEAFASHAVVISIVAIAAAPVEVGIVALAIRLARCQFADYLALAWPRRRDLAVGLLCLLVLLPLADLSTYMSGRGIVPPFVVDAYTSARDSGTLWLLGIALVIAAPLTEELVFRGFMFRGLEASRVGAAGAVILPSAIWAAMHLQYEIFFIVQIFILGLVLGWLRWRSGSTLLTIVLHAIINLSSLVQTAFLVEKLGYAAAVAAPNGPLL